MAVADITNFEVTYKDVMAPIGYKRTMCGMDGSVGGNITRGLDGAFPTFVWSEHGDAPRAVADLDLVYDDEPPPAGFVKIDKDLVGGLDSRCYLCYKLTSEEGGATAVAQSASSSSSSSSSADSNGGGNESKSSSSSSSPSTVAAVAAVAALPICAIAICYDAAHDLTGKGYTKLDKNILAHLPSGGHAAYIHYRRRLPSDRLRWSAKRLELGDLLDARDTVGNWCFAVVIEIDPFTHPNQIKVHFTRWEGTRWDAWYNVSSNALAEYGTRSKEETSIKQGRLWAPPGGIEALDAKIAKFVSVKDDPFKLDELIEKQLDVFLSRCLGYDISPKAEFVPKIYALLREIVEALADQLVSDQPLNAKLLSLGLKCLYGDPTVSYFFRHEGYAESSGVMGIFASKPKIAGLDDDDDHPAPEEDFVRTRGRHGQGDSRYYGALINLFGAKGGFDAILRRMRQPRIASSSSSPPRLSLDDLKKIIAILTKPAEKWYVPSFQERYFPEFERAVFERLGDLSDKELSKLDQRDMEAILTDVESLLLHTLDDFSGDRRLELFQLHMSKTLITCPFLNKRLLGVELLIEWIQRAERKDEPVPYESKVSSLYYGNNYRAAPPLPRAKWLDVRTLAQWLTQERMFEIIMQGNEHLVGTSAGMGKEQHEAGGKTAGTALTRVSPAAVGGSAATTRAVDSHPSIIQKAMQSRGGTTSLLQFLAKQQNKSGVSIDADGTCLSRDMLELLWEDGALSSNQMTSDSCVEELGAASEEFSAEIFGFFNDKIRSFPPSRATEKWVNMFGNYAEMALLADSAEKKRSGSGGFFASITPRKSSKEKATMDSGIVLDKLYEIVFAPRGTRIEADAVSAARRGLLKALKGSAETLQTYMKRMMGTLENSEHVSACISMISGLLPLLSMPFVEVAADGEGDQGDNEDNGTEGKRGTPARAGKFKPNEAQIKNRKNLESLSSTVIRLIIELSVEGARDQDLSRYVATSKGLLVFLDKIMTHADLSLDLEQVKQLWGSCTSNAAVRTTPGSPMSLSFIFFSWLSKAMAGKLVATEAQEQIFHDLIAKRAAEPGTGKDSIPLFLCFKKVFDQINVREGKLRGANRATTLDLTGIDAMWAFLVAETPDESLNACIDKLISLVLGLHKSAYGGSKKKGWETFMEKCMELIRNPEATDAQLQSVLRLLSKFLKKVSKETLQYDPQRPKMIMRAVLDVQWKSNRNPHLPGPWYRCKVDHFNPHDGKHHCTYFDDDDKRWYEFKQVEKGTMARGRNGAVDFRAYLVHGYHDVQIVEWGPHVKSIAKEFVELQRYPRRSLTHNKAHFDNLFNLIGRENRGTVQAAWNLLTAEGVPTNPERKTKLALCGASESEIFTALEVIRNSDDGNDAGSKTMDSSLRATSSASASERMSHPLRQRTLTVADIDSLDESDWVELLGNGSRSPLQLLYSLRIVDSLVFPPQADTSATQLREAKNYGVRFIRSGGFVHLYKILTSGGAGALSKFGDDSLSKQCLVCLLGLFNQFYKQSTANPELQMVVIEQMQKYDLDPNFGDLAPRLLQIVETISGAVETSSSSVTSSSSSSSSRSNRGDYVQNPAADTLTNNDIKDAVGKGASKSDGSYNIESNDNVFDAATMNDAPLSIEGRAVENAMGLLVSIVSRQPDVLDTLVASAAASGAAVSIALLRCADRSVRTRMGSGLNRLCLSSDSSAPNVFVLGLLLGDLDLITRGGDMKYAHQSSEYFMLFEELLKRSTNLESSSPSPSDEGKMQSASSSSGGRISPADLAHRLAAAIIACPIVQQSERDADSRLHGLLACLSALLARDSSQVGMLLKSAVGFDGGLVRHLVERCLFDAPSARTASQALKPPVCKSPQLRRKAFDLLLEMCRGCDTNVREVARLCGPRHVIGDKDMISASKARRSGHTSSTVATSGSSTVVYAGAGSKTAYVDYNGTKSVSGYVGLKNMCCTCYMNSTMQNLFMVLPWRRAILAITDVDLGDKSESIIYQTQRMYAYLQESEKQYYDPKGFCHTYKDPDDPSKPINVRIQQDASAFYGRLLHTISDKLVNTRHENILDVFNVYQVGEKFATGSDGHKYKSKRDEPTEQYVSVSVRGMKNLQTSIAKLFAGETVDFKWDKHDNESEKEELSTRKRITIKKLPPCLPLHLKRFDLDYTTFQTVKLNDRFEFPEEINMFPYTLEGRAYYDERGGAPTVLAGDNGGFASGDAAGDSDAGGKASGDDGAPPGAAAAAADAADAAASSSGSAFEESRDPMFVPASAPHPPEYYRYDLVGITIHSGNANGGHYFSYIRERDGDGRSGCQKSGSGTGNGEVEKRTFKWCEFNDRRVSPWSVDRLEQDCFGGEQEQTFTNAYTGKITTTKRVKFQNAFMLFYERKAPVSTMLSSAAASANKSKVVADLAASVASLAISTASSKRSEGAMEQKTATVEGMEACAGMPAELYEEISGQNMVEWKLRSLLDPSYAEFMQQLVGLTVESTEAKSELIKFGTRYMLGTLVHSGTKRDVARDWRTKLTKAYAGSPEASEWFLRNILDPSNCTLMDNLNNFSKSDPTPGMTSRDLAKAALLAAQRRVSDMSRMTPASVHEAMAAAGAAGVGEGESKGNGGSKSQKQSGDAGANIPYSVQFVHKLIVMIEREPSAKWIYDIVSAFAELGAPEMQYVLRAGLLSTLLNLLDKHGIPTLWKMTASTSSASSTSRSGDEIGATYAQKVARDRPVRVSQEAIILLTTLVTNCLNLDGNTRHNRSDIEATLNKTSRTLISNPLFGERLMQLAFGTQILDMTRTQIRAKAHNFTQVYPYNSQAREMLTHLAWNSPEFGRILIDDVLSHYLDKKLMTTEPLHTVFRFVVFLITLEDELQTSRTKQVLGVVSSFVRRMLDEKILKMTAYLIHHVLMLCSDRVCSHICIPFFTQGEPLALLHDLLAWQVESPCGFGPDAVITREPRTPLEEGQGQFYRDFVASPVEDDWDPWPELSVGGLEQLLEGKRPEMMGYDLHGDDPASIVGRRIEVWWHKEVAMFAGQITRYNSENGKHEVHYDDNEVKWYGLGQKIGYKLRPEGETGWPEGSAAANRIRGPPTTKYTRYY